MGDIMSNISSVHIFTTSYSVGFTVVVNYKSGYTSTYEDFDNFDKIPASVRDFVSPEHYFSTRYKFSEDGFYSCASHFHFDLSNLVGSLPRLDVACIDTLLLTDGPESDPEAEEPVDVAPTVQAFPEFDLEIYVTGAYDCTLEQSARVCVGVHGCPTEFHDLEVYTDNQGYMNIIVDDVYKRFPFLQFCKLPVLRDSHEYQELGKRHVVEIWKIPLPSHYSYTSIHRVWRGCGLL